MSAGFLELLADVVEKSAAYQEALETDNAKMRSQLLTKKEARDLEETEAIVQLVSAHEGTVANDELRAKIAQMPESVRNMLRTLSDKQASTDLGQSVPSKTRAPSYDDDPDAAFEAWVTS